MIEDGTREHESIEQGDGDADGDAVFHLAQHAAGGRAVDIEAVVFAPERSGNDEGLAVGHKSYVAEETFVENAVRRLAIIDGAIGFADQTGPRSWGIGLGNAL